MLGGAPRVGETLALLALLKVGASNADARRAWDGEEEGEAEGCEEGAGVRGPSYSSAAFWMASSLASARSNSNAALAKWCLARAARLCFGTACFALPVVAHVGQLRGRDARLGVVEPAGDVH